MTEVYLQKAPVQDLENIWLYTLAEWGLSQADDYLEDLHATFLLLRTQPLLGRARDDLAIPVRTLSHAHHIIVYDIKHTNIVTVQPDPSDLFHKS